VLERRPEPILLYVWVGGHGGKEDFQEKKFGEGSSLNVRKGREKLGGRGGRDGFLSEGGNRPWPMGSKQTALQGGKSLRKAKTTKNVISKTPQRIECPEKTKKHLRNETGGREGGEDKVDRKKRNWEA